MIEIRVSTQKHFTKSNTYLSEVYVTTGYGEIKVSQATGESPEQAQYLAVSNAISTFDDMKTSAEPYLAKQTAP